MGMRRPLHIIAHFHIPIIRAFARAKSIFSPCVLANIPQSFRVCKDKCCDSDQRRTWSKSINPHVCSAKIWDTEHRSTRSSNSHLRWLFDGYRAGFCLGLDFTPRKNQERQATSCPYYANVYTYSYVHRYSFFLLISAILYHVSFTVIIMDSMIDILSQPAVATISDINAQFHCDILHVLYIRNI